MIVEWDGFTQILLDWCVSLKGNFTVFDDLLALAIWAMHRLESNHC